MSQQTEVLTKEQHDRIERILTYHKGCGQAIESFAAYKYITGAELLALKGDCQHGQFEKVKSDILEVRGMSRSAQGRCMQFAEGVHGKYPTVGYLKPEKLLLKNGRLDSRGVEKVAEFFKEEMDGKSMTEFLRDMGLVREKKHQQHHSRKMTAEEKVQAELDQAKSLIDAARAAIMTVTDDVQSKDSTTVSRIKPQLWKELLGLSTQMNKAIRPLCRRSREGAKSAK